MKSKKTLSVIPYYGGKAKMAAFISERLDYTCDMFVTMFGGACRVLLNKQPHKIEYYNEYDPCLCTLMKVLSNEDTAQQLIDKLYDETEPTEEQFIKARKLYNQCRYDVDDQYQNEIIKYYREHGNRSSIYVKNMLNELWNVFQDSDVDEIFLLINEITNQKKSKEKLRNLIWMWARLKKQREKYGGLPQYKDITTRDIKDVDLAAATYLTYTLSYSGMGKSYVKGKFKNDEIYRRRILNLYDCAERLKGLNISDINAMDFFRQKEIKNDEELRKSPLYQWINNPNVMMFLDPSYLSPKVDKSNKKEKYENLGKIYARSFDEEEHEKFLEGIKNAKCKILVYNYDVELYNKHLTPENGWHKELYPTKTTVFQPAKTEKSNERLEAIWYNY